MKVGGDKEKWLHKAPVQVSQNLLFPSEVTQSTLLGTPVQTEPGVQVSLIK